jgi:hypothetical protein
MPNGIRGRYNFMSKQVYSARHTSDTILLSMLIIKGTHVDYYTNRIYYKFTTFDYYRNETFDYYNFSTFDNYNLSAYSRYADKIIKTNEACKLNYL